MKQKEKMKRKNEWFLNELTKNNPFYEKGLFKVLEPYKGSKTKLLIEDSYGKLLVSPYRLFNAKKAPTIQSAVDKTQYFINQANEVHNYAYDYSKLVYKKSKTKASIICKIHGEFLQTPNNHIQGAGCTKCGRSLVAERQSLGSEEFKRKATQRHGDKYCYKEVDYINNRHKLKILCKTHNEYFYQRGLNHLQGAGCPVCWNEKNAFKFKDWENMCPGNPGIFYILRCWNESEEFFKVGITCQDSISHRYKGLKGMPYDYEVLKEVTSQDRSTIWDMEEKYIQENLINHYTPLLPFKGSSKECFKHIKYE